MLLGREELFPLAIEAIDAADETGLLPVLLALEEAASPLEETSLLDKVSVELVSSVLELFSPIALAESFILEPPAGSLG